MEHIRVNFGQTPFVFDIDGMMSVSTYPFRHLPLHLIFLHAIHITFHLLQTMMHSAQMRKSHAMIVILI